MTSADYFALALLILLLLPLAILPKERGGAPAWLALLLGAAGVAVAAARGGPDAALIALATGISCLILLVIALTSLRRMTQFIFLTGGQIRFLAVGACWLLPVWAALYAITVFVAIVVVAAIKSRGAGPRGRPDTDLIIAISLITIIIIQVLSSV